MTILNTEFNPNISKYIEANNFETIVLFLEEEYETAKIAKKGDMEEMVSVLNIIAGDISEILSIPLPEAQDKYKEFLEDKVKNIYTKRYMESLAG